MANLSAKKAAPKVQPFQFDYNAILEQTSKRFTLNIETYAGTQLDRSISTGLLSYDLVMGNGGVVPGWHTNLGFEQGGKSTMVAHIMQEAVRMGVPMIQEWDYERTFDPYYVSKFWRSCIDPEMFGREDAKGKWLVKPRIRSYRQDTGEEFFDAMHHTLKLMPKKRKIGGVWYLVFPKSRDNLKMFENKYDKGLLKLLDVICIPQEDGRPQGLLVLDSYPAMMSEADDTDEGNNGLALLGRMFSKEIPRIKGFLGSRGIVLAGVNQMREVPMAMYGPKEREPAGQALRMHSDTRYKNTACAVPKGYDTYGTKGDGGHIMEPSHRRPSDKGIDTYRYVTVRCVKNKVGGSPQGTVIHQRVWAADAGGVARGFDPVFDCFQYLRLTGQIQSAEGKQNPGLKGFVMKLDSANPLNGKKMDLHDLKGLIVGNKEAKMAVCKKLKVSGNPRIHEACREQLKTGRAYEIFHAA